jgi:hypothetical protein
VTAEDTNTAEQNDRTALDTLPSGRPPPCRVPEPGRSR